MKRILAGLLLAATVVACASMGRTGTAAERLDLAAQHFHVQVHAEPGARHLEGDARELVLAAGNLRLAIDRNRSRDVLRERFDRVAERYHHLRRQVENDRDAERWRLAGFDRVTDAYLDLEHALHFPRSRHHS